MFLQSLPERQPALLSLLYVGGFALLGVVLFISLLLQGRRARRNSTLAAVAAVDLPEEVRRRLGMTSTNKGLYALRWLFVVLALGVFGFHAYWAVWAENSNERFQELTYKDLRNRRLTESTLRGWILDRSGRLGNALALYRRAGPNNQIVREYPMDTAMAHLLGSDRGSPGLERALFGVDSGAAPEIIDVVRGRDIKQPANLDVRLTIDSDLQQAAVDGLRGRHGAIVALNPQTGDVLAMYSNPAYSLREARDEAAWIRLDADERNSPLLNRALGSYYIPGSTFKTVTMIAAYIAGTQDIELVCSGNGYIAQPGAKVIFDDKGPSEVHGRIGMGKAYEVSCNQYFAQLAVKLGAEQMGTTARLLGIGAYGTPAEAVAGRKRADLWNTGRPSVARALAPRESTIVANPKMRPYDLALVGYGQGYAGQMTPLQMALAAAAIANTEGKLMKPKIEYDVAPVAFSQVTTPEKAADMRRIMNLVTGGSSGTARGVFAPLQAAGIITGGKTGTAQKDVPVYDPKTGEPKTSIRYERDRRGNIIREYRQTQIAPEPRIDSWYLSIAPIDRPQLAIAVIVEGGGYGARAAAPIAAALVMKAGELGLLGDTGSRGAGGNVPKKDASQKDGQPPARKNRKAKPAKPTRSTQTARR